MNRIRALILLVAAAWGITGCLPLPALRPGHEIRIALDLPEAKEVFFLSSLNRYDPVCMNKTFFGTWEIHLPEDKSFEYFFRVDGSPYTPECRLQQTDDWGGRQCIYSPGIQEP
ncbi:MAG: hypothetical protein V1844_21505 [Pseudomonadota bacterium]